MRHSLSLSLLMVVLLGPWPVKADLDQAIQFYTMQDYRSALPLMQEAANTGDSEAQYLLGAMHHYGLGLPKNDQEGMRWYLKAAKQNHTNAQFYLGVLLVEEEKGKNQLDKGLWWIERAVWNGFVQGYPFLTELYREGKYGVELSGVHAYKFATLGALAENLWREEEGIDYGHTSRALMDEIGPTLSFDEISLAGQLVQAWAEKMEFAETSEPTDQPETAPDSDDIEERLRKLGELEEKGLITPDEAKKKRQEILESL